MIDLLAAYEAAMIRRAAAERALDANPGPETGAEFVSATQAAMEAEQVWRATQPAQPCRRYGARRSFSAAQASWRKR